MPETTFESLFADRLREYAQAGVGPIDRFAIADATIASGRTERRFRLALVLGNRVLVPLLIGLMLTALAGGSLLVGGRLLAPKKTPLHAYVNELVSAPDLSLPMAHPALVALPDGRVLVIGDDGELPVPPPRALVYDPATGVSEPTGPLVSTELSVTNDPAVRLKDGRVLVMGDVSAHTNTIAQIFDPSTRRFTPAGPMITPRLWPAVAVLPDGHVLIAGGQASGQDVAAASAELFDPETLTFSATGSMGTSGSVSSAAILPDGRAFILVGASSRTVEVFDPSTGRFSPAGTLSGYGYTDAIALDDGRVVVFGGSSLGSHGFAELWDPASLTFSARRDLPGWVKSRTLLDDGRILLAGERSLGVDGPSTSWSGTFDPTTGVTIPTQTPRAWDPTATRLADGRVLIVGGLTDGMTNHGEGGRTAPAVPTVEIFQ